MEHYVTLFDSFYLPQGLSLHASLERFGGQYQLWIVCIDVKCFNILTLLTLPNVRLINVEECLDAPLRAARNERTIGEFCWTLTPQVFDFVFERDQSIERLSYVDADVWFRKSPHKIFKELEQSGKTVLITDHGYAPDYDQSAVSGQYCVQFLTFYRHGSEILRKRWQSQCLAWCYNRTEEGKFGDQKYLDEWPEKFDRQVHVLQNHGWTLAPWNAIRFPYGNAVLWHFHGLKVVWNTNTHSYDLNIGDGYYTLPNVVREHIYIPYVNDLNNALSRISPYIHTS